MADLNNIQSIIRFKGRLISELPHAPNNKESKDYLLSLDIGDLIHIYDFWQQRLIHCCPRDVTVISKVRNSVSYVRNKEKIDVILNRVKNGIDISKYLSHKAHKATFEVEQFKQNRRFNSFRDQILICEGFHHLHLEEFPKRTDEVLIVHVTPSTFEIVQVAKHNLFERDEKAIAEYYKAIDEFLYSKNPNGGIYIGGAGGGMQNLAGSSVQSSFNQIHTRKILQTVEILNGGIENYVKNLYKYIHHRDLKYVKPEWKMLGREIVIYDKKNQEEFKSDCLLYKFYLNSNSPIEYDNKLFARF
jgi:hypothetical protein